MEFVVRIASKWASASLMLAFALLSGSAQARELDFLQTDPRFTGGEVNPANPTHPNFWFYDQYTAAHNTLQKAGVNVIPITSLNLTAMTADSDAFYIPPPTNPAASTYPLTNQEISVVQQYVATGRSIIFNLGGAASSTMDNDLLNRLGLTGTQAADTTSGTVNFPLPNQPIVGGAAYGAVSTYSAPTTGYFSSLGTMRSLEDIGDVSVIPYVEKGDFGYHQGAYIFLLDRNYLTNWANESASQQNLFMNMVIYVTDPWSTRYIPTAVNTPLTVTPIAAQLPEPGLALLGVVAGAGLLRRGKRKNSES